ncbi:MAG: MAPEG family protein [Pseudomonadota bacterium]
MTPDLTYLAYTAVLTALLWLPYIVGRSLAVEMPNARVYRDPTFADMPAWVKRCDRAHVNAVESLIPFAALVIVAHLAGATNETTAMWAMVFFWARVGHAVVFWMGIPFVRTLAFAVGLVATLGIAWEVLGAAPVAG